MTREELFKKNFPEYVTEKGECLNPYWDLFNAGIECATYELNKGCIQILTKEKAELEAQIEKMKSQYDYAFNQLCKSREILCSMLSQYRDRKEIDYSTRECGEKILKEGVYNND